MDASFDLGQSFAMPRPPDYERPDRLSCEAFLDDGALSPTAHSADTSLPTADGPRLSTSSLTRVFCASVATSLFVHLDSEEAPACRSYVNFVEAGAIVQLLLDHGRQWLREGYSIRILCTYLAQATLLKKVLELLYTRATHREKPHLNELLSLPISTVDSAQGTEADIVLASLVRANSRHSTGFVSDARRSNVLISRARIAQFTFGHGPTLASSNWNDFTALFAIYEDLGALLAASPDHWWLPATVAEVTSRSGRVPLQTSTPRLDSALEAIVSKHGRELSASPFAANVKTLLARLEGCTRDPLQVGREAKERAGQATTEPPPPPPQQWVPEAIARCAALEEGQALHNLIGRAATATCDVMSSLALPPVLQHLASLRTSMPFPDVETSHQFDLKSLSHQGYFSTQDLGRDPGNECLAVAWSGLCLAAGIALPLGRCWPAGRADWSCPSPLGPSRACLRHPAPFSGVARAPGALTSTLNERVDICLLMRSLPVHHQAAYLIRYLCVNRERILFPPTTDDHLSDAGDYIEAIAATVRPWNASIRKLTTDLLDACGLTFDEAEHLHERLTRFLSACKALLRAASDLQVRALSTADDPWRTLSPMVRPPSEPLDPQQVAERLTSPPPPLRIDAPLQWIRDRLSVMGGIVTSQGCGCCLCAALVDLPQASPRSTPPSGPAALQPTAAHSPPQPVPSPLPPHAVGAPTAAGTTQAPSPIAAAAPGPRPSASPGVPPLATSPGPAPAPCLEVSLSESDRSDKEARSPSAVPALPLDAGTPTVSATASARTDPGSLRQDGSEPSRRRRRRRSRDRSFRHDLRQARNTRRSRTRAAPAGSSWEDPYGIFSATHSVASNEDPGDGPTHRRQGRRAGRRPRAPPPARSSSPQRRARSLSPRSSRRPRRMVPVVLRARGSPGAPAVDNRLDVDLLARRITCDACGRAELLHSDGAFLSPALRASKPHMQEKLAREGADSSWHCQWCWGRRLLGDDLSTRAYTPVATSLILDKVPASFADTRFNRHAKDRQHTCDAPGCNRTGAASDMLGDWLYDQDNKERFRAENLCQDAVASGRVGDRSTFKMRDASHIPMASAPIPFPRLALNQPTDLSNLRCQLWWTARWNATWYCKYCIASRYTLSHTVLDDYLRRRSDKKRSRRFQKDRRHLPASPAGDHPPQDDAPAPTGAARLTPSAPPTESHLAFSLPFPGTLLHVSISSAPLTSLLFPAAPDDPGLSDSVVLDLSAGDRSRHHPFRRSLLALLRESRGPQGHGLGRLPPVRPGRASDGYYDFERGPLHCVHVGAGSCEHATFSGWADTTRFAAELLILGLTALAESTASRLLIPPLTVGRLRPWSARSGMLAAEALSAAMAAWPPDRRADPPLDLSGRTLILVVDHRSIGAFRSHFAALADHLASNSPPSQATRDVRRRTGEGEPHLATSAREATAAPSTSRPSTDAKSRSPPPGARRERPSPAIGALPTGRNPHAGAPRSFLAVPGSQSRRQPRASGDRASAHTSTPADPASASHTAEDDRLLSRRPRPTASDPAPAASALPPGRRGGNTLSPQPAAPPLSPERPPARRVMLDWRPSTPRVAPDASPVRLVLANEGSLRDVVSSLGDDRQLADSRHWRPALRRLQQPPPALSSGVRVVHLRGSPSPPQSPRGDRPPPEPPDAWSPWQSPR